MANAPESIGPLSLPRTIATPANNEIPITPVATADHSTLPNSWNAFAETHRAAAKTSIAAAPCNIDFALGIASIKPPPPPGISGISGIISSAPPTISDVTAAAALLVSAAVITSIEPATARLALACIIVLR